MSMPMQNKIASPLADNRLGGMREAVRIIWSNFSPVIVTGSKGHKATVGTDRSRKMMQIAPTDASNPYFWSQNGLRNMFGHLGGNLAPEVQTILFLHHVIGWTGGTHKLSVSDQRS